MGFMLLWNSKEEKEKVNDYILIQIFSRDT